MLVKDWRRRKHGRVRRRRGRRRTGGFRRARWTTWDFVSHF